VATVSSNWLVNDVPVYAPLEAQPLNLE